MAAAFDETELRALLDGGATDAATTLALETYGAELVGWLTSILGEADAHEAFSIVGEELWRSLPRFDGRCSLRTWCYMLARAATSRVLARPARRHEQLVSQIPSVAHAVTRVWSTTLRASSRERDVYARIRDELDDEDRTLLVLRVDKDLAWRDIALVLLGAETSDDEVTREAAALRKQFERVKERLRELAAKHMRE
jgi:RNA polymerase sigma-70 factor (ECF subfamily)